MIFSVDGNRIVRGEVCMHRYGDMWADVTFEQSPTLSASPSIVLGDLAMPCQVESGGESASVGRYILRSGLKWNSEIEPRTYYSPQGIRLRNVLFDLAKECGVDSTTSLDNISFNTKIGEGKHYLRPGTYGNRKVIARNILARIAPFWYVDVDGWTRFGARELPEVSVKYNIVDRNMAHGIRYLGTESIKGVIPGMTLEGARIGKVYIAIKSDDVRLEAWEVRP